MSVNFGTFVRCATDDWLELAPRPKSIVLSEYLATFLDINAVCSKVVMGTQTKTVSKVLEFSDIDAICNKN